MLRKIYFFKRIFSFAKRTAERGDVEGGKAHRISGYLAVSWFRNRLFRERKVGGATVE